jgi:CHAT domain-containing protein/predicted negative regulator of RcsB-dependent stress response
MEHNDRIQGIESNLRIARSRSGFPGNIVTTLILTALIVLHAPLAVAGAASPDLRLSPEQYLVLGTRHFQTGNLQAATEAWEQARKLSGENGSPAGQIRAMILIAYAYRSGGLFDAAKESLSSALELSRAAGTSALTATVLGQLGNVHLDLGSVDKAYTFLAEAEDLARSQNDPALSAAISNDMGNVLAARGQRGEALRIFREGVSQAEKAGDRLMTSRILINAAMVTLEEGGYQGSRDLLLRALSELENVDPSGDRVLNLTNAGIALNRLRTGRGQPDRELLILAQETLTSAAAEAEDLGNRRLASYALGHLGSLYEEQGKYVESLQITRRAMFAAQQVAAPESLYRWQWQSARILSALGERDEAIASYRLAVYSLQAVRHDVAYGIVGKGSFRQSFGHLYLELVDLLLKRAGSARDREVRVRDLREAREVVEILKVAELRDYFRDDCVDAARLGRTELDVVSKTAVVLYPVVLPDRLELLVSFPDGLRSYTTAVSEKEITREILQFRRKLEKRTTREFLPHAQKLYDWLIRPLDPDLAPLSVKTLVMVPDGPFSTIPMAALHDGKQFLISRFATAITPGLSLSDPKPIDPESVKVLAFGLTQSVQGFPPLPFVSNELRVITDIYEGNVLVDDEFTLPQMEASMRNEEYSIVHIASHGRFDRDVDKSYLLAFDERLSVEKLSDLIGLLKFREDPLDLLTLSACDTAVGDERAALGLAGIAIKAGADSALATLWHLNDQATSMIVSEFYRQLQASSISRAEALRLSQLKMLDHLWYQHPGYWSPFLLINNWL